MDDTLAIIEEKLKILKPKKILEIGTAIAYSTIVMHKIPNPYQIRDSLRKQYMAARQNKGTVLMETLNSPPPPQFH